MKRTTHAALALVALATLATGCVRASGDFDGIGFNPTATAFAVADRHTITQRDGTAKAILRPEGDRELTLVFSGAEADPNDDWQRLPRERLSELKRQLATRDGILIGGLKITDIVPGAEFSASLTGPGAYGGGDYEVGVVVDADVALDRTDTGLGSDLDVKLTIDDGDPKAGGQLTGHIEVTRNRGEDQEGNVATGEVSVDFTVPVVAERLGKANLAHLLPVMRCAALEGAVGAAACHDEAPLPYIDATGVVIGR